MKIEIIPNKDWLYDKCENMEQLYDKYYYPLLIKNKELKKQQQEFINWLKAMSKMYEEEYKDIDVAEHYNCVLQKYKEIIGSDINVGSKGENKDE